MIKMDVDLLEYPKAKSQLTFVRGDTIELELSVIEGSVASDLTGWLNFELTIDKSSRPKDNFNSYTSVGVLETVVDPATPSKIVFELPVINDGGNYYFDIQAETSTGSIITLLLGSCKILQDINLS